MLGNSTPYKLLTPKKVCYGAHNMVFVNKLQAPYFPLLIINSHYQTLPSMIFMWERVVTNKPNQEMM